MIDRIVEAEMQTLLRIGVMHEKEVRAAMRRIAVLTIERCARVCETDGMRGCDKDNVACHKVDAEKIRALKVDA